MKSLHEQRVIYRPLRTRTSQGQTLVEYALIIAFISVVSIAVLISLGLAADKSKIAVAQQLAIAQSSH